MARKLSKRYKGLIDKVDPKKEYLLEDSIVALKELKSAKFDETVDMVMHLNVDPRYAEQMIRGAIVLPNGTGKSVRVAVFAKGAKVDEAKAAGADIVGNDDLVADIKSGKIDFDVCVATPDCMGLVGQIGKILGPKGLMPNPKTGTVTPDVTKAVNNLKSGQVNYRVDKKGNIHVGLGKVSFDNVKLVENIKELVKSINKAKPSTVKGKYIKSAYVSLTMSPAVKLDSSELLEIK